MWCGMGLLVWRTLSPPLFINEINVLIVLGAPFLARMVRAHFGGAMRSAQGPRSPVIGGGPYFSLAARLRLPPRLPAASMRRRNVGHSICDGAAQSATWRSVSRKAVSSRICRSISSAFRWRASRGRSGVPFRPNMPVISSSENPANLPMEINLSCNSTSGGNCLRKPCRETEEISPASS